MVSNLRFGLLGFAMAALGCTQAAKPDDQLAASEASVRTAQEIGAQAYPRAALSLQLAIDELQRAKDLIKNGDIDKARYQLLRSRADGDLALALTRSAQALAEAQAARDRLQTLQTPESQQ